MTKKDFLMESVKILRETPNDMRHDSKIMAMLEDVTSPIQMKYNQALYDSILSRKHIDFDKIPDSKGDVTRYAGYANMKKILKIMSDMDEFSRTEVVHYVRTVDKALENILLLRDVYQKGFDNKCEYVMLEYNTYVYTCVEATTSILYEFVDYIKRPEKGTYEIVLKNNSYRANLFYVQQLEKFNNVNRTMLADHRKLLEAMMAKDKSDAIGASFAVGSVVIAVVAASIVPITRELIYQFYNTKRKLSECLAQQAYFLEMNKTQLEANNAFTKDKKDAILRRQEALKKNLLKLSEALRVSDVRGMEKTKRDLNADNREITMDKLRSKVEDSDLTFL